MSNVKDVNLEARVPFTWLQPPREWDATGPGGPEHQERAAFIANMLLSPSMGLRHEYRQDGYEPNNHGGRTAMYRLRIYGTEALRSTTVEYLCETIELLGGTVTTCTEIDLENPGEPIIVHRDIHRDSRAGSR